MTEHAGARRRGQARTYDVLVFGDYFLDLIFSGLAQRPEPGREVLCGGFAMIPGGAFNSAVAMRRLGLSVGWAGDFGDDDFSRFALARARAEGLDDRLFVHHRRALRHITVAANYDDDRAFLTFTDPDPRLPAGLRALAAARARAVYVAGFYCGPFLRIGSSLARARGMKLIMDGNSPDPALTLARAAVRRAVAAVDVFMPNAEEARRLTGCPDLPSAIRALAALGPLVVVKAGAAGAYACHHGQVSHAAAIRVTPVDTTGAGDCFNAGYIRAWLDGRTIAECLRWGNVVGGLSTTAAGGTGRRVTTADVEAYLAGTQL